MPVAGAFAINRYAILQYCCFSGFWSCDPNVLLVAKGETVPFLLFFLRFADVGLCVQTVVTVHFDLNRIRLERLFSIFFLQR